MGDDWKAFVALQTRNQFICDSKGQIVLAVIAAGVCKWKHNHGGPGENRLDRNLGIIIHPVPEHDQINYRHDQGADDHIIQLVASLPGDRCRFGNIRLFPDAIRCKFISPGEKQGQWEADREQEQDEVKYPGRHLDVIQDDVSHLHDEPRNNYVGSAYSKDITAFELFEKGH